MASTESSSKNNDEKKASGNSDKDSGFECNVSSCLFVIEPNLLKTKA